MSTAIREKEFPLVLTLESAIRAFDFLNFEGAACGWLSRLPTKLLLAGVKLSDDPPGPHDRVCLDAVITAGVP